MKKEWIIWAVIGLLMGCNSLSDSHTEYMAFENVNYIKEFPCSYSLKNDQLVDWDVIGVKSFCFFDSLLVITSNADKNGLWHFLTAKDYRFLGNYLTQGGGPGEFKELPKVSDAKFYNQENQIFADIYDFSGGKYYRINVSHTLENNQLDIQTVKSMLPAGLFDQVYIDSSTVYCRMITNMQSQQLRYLWKNGEEITPEKYEQLNRVFVHNQDFNILSTITKKNPDNDLLVEAAIGLDQINLFSAEGDFAMTICPNKKKLDAISDIENLARWERIYTYGGVRTYPDFFAALYVNEDERAFQTERKAFPTIQLFDWKGNALMQIKLNRFITSFDFDFCNGYIYAFDSREDTMYKYEVNEILNQLYTML